MHPITYLVLLELKILAKIWQERSKHLPFNICLLALGFCQRLLPELGVLGSQEEENTHNVSLELLGRKKYWHSDDLMEFQLWCQHEVNVVSPVADLCSTQIKERMPVASLLSKSLLCVLIILVFYIILDSHAEKNYWWCRRDCTRTLICIEQSTFDQHMNLPCKFHTVNDQNRTRLYQESTWPESSMFQPRQDAGQMPRCWSHLGGHSDKNKWNITRCCWNILMTIRANQNAFDQMTVEYILVLCMSPKPSRHNIQSYNWR